MTREEMLEKVFGNAKVDKLPPHEKKLMTDSEIAIFNTAYEEGWDDGYSDGTDDRHKDCYQAYRNGIMHTMKWFEHLLINDARLDEKFVKHVIMEWAATDLLTER